MVQLSHHPDRGSTGGAVVSHVNNTRGIRSEQGLAHRASHDSLAGLGNRILFAEALGPVLGTQRGRRPKADVGVLYFDLDGFKTLGLGSRTGQRAEGLLNAGRERFRPSRLSRASPCTVLPREVPSVEFVLRSRSRCGLPAVTDGPRALSGAVPTPGAR